MNAARRRWMLPSLLAFVLACSSKNGPPGEAVTSAGTAGTGNAAGLGGTSNSAGSFGAGGASHVAGASGLVGLAGDVGGPNGGGSSGAAGNAGAGGRVSNAGSLGDAGASNAGAPDGATECGYCDGYGASAQTGAIAQANLDALSGMAASRTQAEIVFAHNDHDRPVVFALDLEGREHARITLEGAPATDIEDIAVGSCGAQICVYLGDIGDNSATRSEYAVLRFIAPRVPASPGTSALTVEYERLRFTYEDGSHNAESLMVARDGTLYIVTKVAPGSGGRVAATSPSSVYRLPASMTADSVARATKVATLLVPRAGELAASAAAAHPCDERFLLRTYDRVYEFKAPAGMGFEAAFGATPSIVATPEEPQSEGIDYLADGRSFVTSGEGTGAPIVRTSCAP